jgi:hypothetical protein
LLRNAASPVSRGDAVIHIDSKASLISFIPPPLSSHLFFFFYFSFILLFGSVLCYVILFVHSLSDSQFGWHSASNIIPRLAITICRNRNSSSSSCSQLDHFFLSIFHFSILSFTHAFFNDTTSTATSFYPQSVVAVTFIPRLVVPCSSLDSSPYTDTTLLRTILNNHHGQHKHTRQHSIPCNGFLFPLSPSGGDCHGPSGHPSGCPG